MKWSVVKGWKSVPYSITHHDNMYSLSSIMLQISWIHYRLVRCPNPVVYTNFWRLTSEQANYSIQIMILCIHILQKYTASVHPVSLLDKLNKIRLYINMQSWYQCKYKFYFIYFIIMLRQNLQIVLEYIKLVKFKIQQKITVQSKTSQQ
jgi:hypothetical protein